MPFDVTDVTTLSGPRFVALPPLALYVHIPWCLRKCPYCDFNSHEAKGDAPEAAYVEALLADRARKPFTTIAEFRARLPDGSVLASDVALSVKSNCVNSQLPLPCRRPRAQFPADSGDPNGADS